MRGCHRERGSIVYRGVDCLPQAHRIDHFYFYDNDPAPALRSRPKAWEDFVTVIDWPAFFNVDEFIALRQRENLPAFLSGFEGFGSVQLHWHVFGHNGHDDDPGGLIITALTRWMSKPSIRTRSISRTAAIAAIDSAHRCRLKRG
jgi:hypothetical protein